MSETNKAKSVPKTDKTSRVDSMAASIRPIIPKSKKGIYPFYDGISSEIAIKHGSEDFYRAVFSSIFFKGTSKVATEKASRRKFRCNPSQKLDLSKLDHIASMFFEVVASGVNRMPQSSFRLLCIEHIPEMLAALTTAERETINIKSMLLVQGREVRKKKAEQNKTVVTTEEPLKNGIVAVEETEVPTVVPINESEPELASISEPILMTTPEITSEVISESENSIAEIPVLSETTPVPQRERINLSALTEDPSTFKNYE